MSFPTPGPPACFHPLLLRPRKASGAADRLSGVCSLPTCQGLRSTHRIEEHGEKELAPIDDLVQLAGATRVLTVEDGVREEAAGLPRENLGWGRGELWHLWAQMGSRDPSSGERPASEKAASCAAT